MNNKARPIDANNIEIFLHQMRYAAATHGMDYDVELISIILEAVEKESTIKVDDGWISVKDKLPAVTVDTHTSQIVMCFSRDNEYEFFFDVYNALSKKFMSEAQNGCKVTHWRPLPKKPKGE